MNSNGSHAHIEARVGALRVRYCAVPVVAEDREKSDRGQDADESAETDALRGEGNDAVFALPLQQQHAPRRRQGYANGDVEMFGSGEGMRLRLVDEQQMLRRRVNMVTPQKGDRFL